jgi:Carboxypeptidase regulatory-like domain
MNIFKLNPYFGRSLCAALLAALAITLTACGGGTTNTSSSSASPVLGSSGNDGVDQTPTPASTTLQGRVLDAQDGSPIANALVKAGNASTLSNASGTYLLDNVEPGTRIAVVAMASNYAETVKLASGAANMTTLFDVKLIKVGISASLSQSVGGVVSVPGSVAQVTLPANFAVRADGSVPVGPITVTVTPIAPALESSFMPGDYTTVTGTGTVAIESFGALTVNLIDSSGLLNLAPGKTATIRIPVSTRSTQALAATIPLWFVSTQTGRWIQEGSATLQGTAPNQYYEGVVSHFSTWNADQVMNTITVTGCVNDENGQPAGSVMVRSDGINYSGASSATTNASGSFTISIRRDGIASLGGFIGNKFTNEISVGAQTSSFSVTTCLTLATAVNSIKIKLTWGQSPLDVDSYLTLPTGEVISYSNEGSLLAAPFANLDFDDTSSYGPEVVTIRRPMVGSYKYAVRNYSGTNTPGITGSPAKVELTLGDVTSIFAPPAGEPTSGNTVWSVFNLTVAADCSTVVTLVDAWSIVKPVSTATIADPVYCQAP